jgi:ATP-dependent protease ClpP protease subunit
MTVARFPRSWRIRAGASGLTERIQLEPPTGQRWYEIRNATSPEATIMVYGEIGFWGVTASDFARELEQVTARRINVRISSEGGECFDGFAIYEAIRRHPADVTVYVDSLAASIASVIAMAGDRVVMAETASMMIHEPSGVCAGTATDMDEMKAILNRLGDTIAGVYAKRAGGEVAEWRSLMHAETWFSASEAVAVGLADEVDGAEADDDEDQGDDDEVDGDELAAILRRAVARATPARPPATTPSASAFREAMERAVFDHGAF